MLGPDNPTRSELVRATLRGIKRKLGKPQQRAKPLTREILFKVLENMGEDLRAIRDRAILLVGFAGAFRRSELCELRFEDIEFLPDGMKVTLKRSKVDQEGIGRTIAIPIAQVRWCPVAALRKWLFIAGIAEGPIFRTLDRRHRVLSYSISGEAVSIIIKQRVAAVGLDPNYFSGHSLRAGFATSASAANVSSWKIREQTGHRSDKVLYRYIRPAQSFRDNANFSLFDC
jgi:integrase